MAARQTNSRSSNSQTSSTKKRTTQIKSGKRSNGKSSTSGKGQKMTKEEIAEQSAFHDEIMLVITLVISVLLLLANFGMGGFVGNAVNMFIRGIFGTLAYVMPVAVFIAVAFHLSNRGNLKATKKIITGVVLFVALMAFFQMLTGNYELNVFNFYQYGIEHNLSGGFIGGIVCKLLNPLFGAIGTYVILIAIFLICFMIFTGKTIVTALSRRGEKSLHEMRERYRENVTLRQEYRQQTLVEDDLNKTEQKLEKRNAKIFTLQKKSYEIDEETGEIKGESLNDDLLTSGENQGQAYESDMKANKMDKSNRKTRTAVDMAEIEPNMENLSISGSYVSSFDIPTYEDELNEKFGKSITAMAEPVGDARVKVESMYSDHKENSVVGEDNAFIDHTLSQEATIHHEKSLEEKEHHQSKHSHSSHQEAQGKSNETSLEVTTDDIAKEIQEKEEKPYVFPPMDLLAKPKKNVTGMTEHDLKETASKLQKTLESFGVRASITNVTCGPAVTRYEIQPEQGVKVSTITKLADDIKLNLAATDIRIEAPIPGKAAVGIEVPNKENSTVMFRELIENKKFSEHPSDIAFAVGKDIGGQNIITDIAKMPHLLIAGATGSGKSVCINTLIMSILYKADPKDVKLIMVDPKVVELSIYNGIPHLMIPVVTDPKKASAALNWAVVEMNNRYKRFADVGVRDVKSYNAKIQQVEYLNDERYKKMPQIVIIVDELADLMMVAKGEVEEAICRLAQMARAAGLHLVIATQRPSVNVITGIIKANVPSRIAFAVSSAIDSRTIIDSSGAEKLLGKGDMLFFPQGYPKPVRLQGAFISDKEVSAVVDFLSKENGSVTYSEDVSEHIMSSSSIESSSKSTSDLDEYFVQAGKFIIEKDKASIGMLQRVYKIGFNRAARIMDQLCEAGVVGPEEGTKPRKVIMSMDEFDQYVDECV